MPVVTKTKEHTWTSLCLCSY